jgi:hypothetical protein
MTKPGREARGEGGRGRGHVVAVGRGFMEKERKRETKKWEKKRAGADVFLLFVGKKEASKLHVDRGRIPRVTC